MNEARDYLREAGLTEGQIGNLEAMREVVTALAEVILPPERPGNEDDSLAWVRAMQVKARAALAKPPRRRITKGGNTSTSKDCKEGCEV